MLTLPDLPYLSNSNGNQLKLNVTAQGGSKQRFVIYSDRVNLLPALLINYGFLHVTSFFFPFFLFRDCSLHQLIFKENGLPNGSKLAYCVKGEVVLLCFCVCLCVTW